jgi:hypothetical protein
MLGRTRKQYVPATHALQLRGYEVTLIVMTAPALTAPSRPHVYRRRALVVLACMAIFTGVYLAVGGVRPLGHEGLLAATLGLALAAAIIVIMVCGYMGVFGPSIVLAADPQAGVVLVSQGYSTNVGVVALLILGGPGHLGTAIATLHTPVLPVVDQLTLAFTILSTIACGFLLVVTIGTRPRLGLYREGVRLEGLFSGYAVPWTAMSAGSVQKARVQLDHPDQVALSGLAWRDATKTSLRLGRYRYAVSWAVDRYVGRPDAQARIGTADETALLRGYLDQRRFR